MRVNRRLGFFSEKQAGAPGVTVLMPHYYFHIGQGADRVEDREGMTLPDQEAAWYHAWRSAAEHEAASAGSARILQVEDELGVPVLEVPVSELLRLVA
jgi:hypothetical protein